MRRPEFRPAAGAVATAGAAGATAGPDDIRSWARTRLAAFKLPYDIRIVLARKRAGRQMTRRHCAAGSRDVITFRDGLRKLAVE
jgi:hypothetical protein